MNPVKKVRIDKNLNKTETAELLNSNYMTITNVEKGDCLISTYLTFIRKMSLEFDDIDDKNLLKEYENWLKDNDIKLKDNS